MWGIFPTQFLSLNPILLSESKNSKNSGIFWNLWNLSANMTYLAFLPKQNTFPTQIEVPGPILMSKRRNLWDSSNLEFILESLESRFQISEILQISAFWHQNRFWGFNLSGKSAPFGKNGQIFVENDTTIYYLFMMLKTNHFIDTDNGLIFMYEICTLTLIK